MKSVPMKWLQRILSGGFPWKSTPRVPSLKWSRFRMTSSKGNSWNIIRTRQVKRGTKFKRFLGIPGKVLASRLTKNWSATSIKNSNRRTLPHVTIKSFLKRTHTRNHLITKAIPQLAKIKGSFKRILWNCRMLPPRISKAANKITLMCQNCTICLQRK